MLTSLSRILMPIRMLWSASKPTLFLLLFLFPIFAVWWWGAGWTIDGEQPLATTTSRIFCTVAYLLSWILVFWAWQWRKLRVTMQADQPAKPDPKELKKAEQEQQRWYERFHFQLDGAMESVRSFSKQSQFPYQTPWYLCIGASECGKSSLVNRSGETFKRQRITTDGHEVDLDCWVGENSMIWEPSSELLNAEQANNGSEEKGAQQIWKSYLEWLAKYRQRQPLNGIIIGVDAASLITRSETERKAQAALIQTRLVEINQTLSSRVPVYLVVTKLDLLEGFEHTFASLSAKERAEALGFSVNLSSQDAKTTIASIESQFEHWAKDLAYRASAGMGESRIAERGQQLFAFSRQMKGLNEMVMRLLNETFTGEVAPSDLGLRGVFLTSAFQQGVMVNAFSDATSRRYEIDNPIGKTVRSKVSQAYFIEQLFQAVLYKEAGLASGNLSSLKKAARKTRVIGGLGIAAAAAMVGVWHVNYQQNIERSDSVLAKANSYQALNQVASSTSLRSTIQALNELRDSAQVFGDYKGDMAAMKDFALFQGHKIAPEIEQTYHDVLQKRFVPLLLEQVVYELKHAKNDEQKLEALRVYKMVVDKSGRITPMVEEYFSQLWQEYYVGRAAMQNDLMDHLLVAMETSDLETAKSDADVDAIMALYPHDVTIKHAQYQLGKLPIEQRVYQGLRRNSQFVLGPALHLDNLIGPSFALVFDEQRAANRVFTVPQLFTPKGLNEYFIPKLESVSELALIDSWVLGETESTQFSEADVQALRGMLLDLYITDYARSWTDVLDKLDMRYFTTLSESTQVLENLVANAEPLMRLLRVVEENTQIGSDNLIDQAVSITWQAQSREKVNLGLKRHFGELNDMLTPVGEKPPYVHQVIDSIDTLHQYLVAMEKAPSQGGAALDAIKDKLLSQRDDPIDALARIAEGLPAPLNRLIGKVAEESWYVVKQEATAHLGKKWYQDVYLQFEQKLKGRYPFNPHARKEASLQDFETFFAPNGTLDAFYATHLKPLIVASRNKDDSSFNLPINPYVLHQINQSHKIQQAFFNKKGILDVSFSIEPRKLTSNKRRGVLNIDGQYLAYSHGRRDSVELIWPNSLKESAESKVTLVPIQGNSSPRSVVLRGPWAFFRLLDQGEVVRASATSIDYRFSFDNGAVTYRVASDEDDNPFTQDVFKSFKLTRNLY